MLADYVKAEQLRTRITFQSPTVTPDGGGAQVANWENVAINPTVWARWINAHGQEMVINQSLQSNQRATVTIRHRMDVLTSWRILRDDGSYWQILSLDEIRGHKRWIEMVVERVTGSV